MIFGVLPIFNTKLNDILRKYEKEKKSIMIFNVCETFLSCPLLFLILKIKRNYFNCKYQKRKKSIMILVFRIERKRKREGGGGEE